MLGTPVPMLKRPFQVILRPGMPVPTLERPFQGSKTLGTPVLTWERPFQIKQQTDLPKRRITFGCHVKAADDQAHSESLHLKDGIQPRGLLVDSRGSHLRIEGILGKITFLGAWNARSKLGTAVPTSLEAWNARSNLGTPVPNVFEAWHTHSKVRTAVPRLKNFSETVVKFLPRAHSDQNAFLLQCDGFPQNRGERPFRFKAAWNTHQDYKLVLTDCGRVFKQRYEYSDAVSSGLLVNLSKLSLSRLNYWCGDDAAGESVFIEPFQTQLLFMDNVTDELVFIESFQTQLMIWGKLCKPLSLMISTREFTDYTATSVGDIHVYASLYELASRFVGKL
ncbi:hypothetical protein Fmac_032773 [Flemingia macrophylla]|uniref:Uncharacterized protein n=1 Tax=Flemingia macrophylla TaxID=520843 RepID=A0ABD1L5X0_9FABA